MCFSAPVSFTAAAFLAVAGVATLKNVTDKKEYVLAAFPLIFATQQFVEGLTWLFLSGHLEGDPPYALGYIFFIYADVMWPLLVPIGVYLIEPQGIRKKLMVPLVFAGFACAAYLLYMITAGTISSSIYESHIRYRIRGIDFIPHIDLIYLFVVSASFLITSHRIVMLFGILLVSSFIATNYYMREVYVSVWCFFAAILSLILCWHFYQHRNKT